MKNHCRGGFIKSIFIIIMDYEAEIAQITHRAQADPQVIGVMLYGSYLRSTDFRDIDIALIPYLLQLRDYGALQFSQFRSPPHRRV